MRLGKVKERIATYVELAIKNEQIDEVISTIRASAKQQIRALGFFKENQAVKLSVANAEFSRLMTELPKSMRRISL